MFRETQTEFFKALIFLKLPTLKKKKINNLEKIFPVRIKLRKGKNRIVYLMQYIYNNFFFNFFMILWDFILIRYLIWELINVYYIYVCHFKIYIFFVFDLVFSLIF